MPPTSRTQRRAEPRRTNAIARGRGSWIDQVADEVKVVLREHGLDLEILVMFGPIGEPFRAVGYDGAPRAYFSDRDAINGPSGFPTPRDNPMSDIVNRPAAKRRETNLDAPP